jgi:4a-hydroxytetrahydrobiopterin dehydratase
MTRPKALSALEQAAELGKLPHWKFKNDRIIREFEFENFIQAFSFMTAMALEAQTLNHHPEWFNVFNRVKVELSTHDTEPAGGGLSKLDIALALKMDSYFARFKNLQSKA